MTIEELKDKKIAVAGLGINNQKLADFFSQQNIKYDVISGWEKPEDLNGKFDAYDIVFRTPSLPYLSVPIQEAQKKGVLISSQTKLFFENCPCPIIGVTGTKGKGTTSSLIAKILEATDKRIWLAGNIGRDPFEFISQVKYDDLVVLELSSFQLQDLDRSPHLAVVLSITPDHLNHHEDFEEYVRAKSSIVNFQNENDFAILHPSLPDWFQALGKATKVYIDTKKVKGYKTQLLGLHNLENIAAAVSVGKIFEISEDKIRQIIETFEPLPHRLQIIGEKNGITFVDDSISTNEESTIAALNTFDKPIVAILGGSSKGLSYAELGKSVKENKNLKAVVVIGEVAPKILEEISGFKGKILTDAKNMEEIFLQIKSIAESGDVVLLSPAAASFDMFKSYKDRGEQFIEALQKL